MSQKPRVKIPETIKPGDVVEVKTLINHVMETGNRKQPDGTPIPRNIIHTFTATYAGTAVFTAHLASGVSANPYIAFYVKVPAAGDLELTWIDDAGVKIVERVALAVA